jgi:anthranilate/para-aminobenzoate synthase component I
MKPVKPWCQAIAYLPPIAAVNAFSAYKLVLLDSTAPANRFSQYSFLGLDPFLIVRAKAGHLSYANHQFTTNDPFFALRRVCQAYPLTTWPALPPFQGGAWGFWAMIWHAIMKRCQILHLINLIIPIWKLAYLIW